MGDSSSRKCAKNECRVDSDWRCAGLSIVSGSTNVGVELEKSGLVGALRNSLHFFAGLSLVITVRSFVCIN